MDKKKIAFIVFEPEFSGQGRAVRDIIDNINDEFESCLICQKSNVTLSSVVPAENLMACSLSKTVNLDLFKAVSFLKKQKADAIHLHGFEGLIWGHSVALLAGLPIIFTPHTIDMYNQFLYFFFKNFWRFFTFLKTKTLITVSHNDKKILIKRNMTPADKVKPIYLAVDKHRYDGVLAEQKCVEGIPDGKFIVLQVGHLSIQKDPLSFFRAAKSLTSKYEDIVFVHAGSGPMSGQMKAYVKYHNLEEKALLLGQRSDIFEVMGRANVVVNSSNWEGLPFTIIDAAHLGKPTVVSNVNGNVDIIKDGKTGFVFEKGDYEALAAKVEALYLDKEHAAKLGAALKKSIKGQFEYDEMLTAHKDVYRAAVR